MPVVKNPGHGSICRKCTHWDENAWLARHTNPCNLVRWVGSKHYNPKIVESGLECPDAEPALVTAE